MSYNKILEKELGKTVLIISHNPTFKVLRNHFYTTDQTPSLDRLSCIEMPTHVITNELDKWILAAIHEV
jgi:hypothetical protein